MDTDILSAGLGQSPCSPESLELGKHLKHLPVCFGTKEGGKGKEEEEGPVPLGWKDSVLGLSAHQVGLQDLWSWVYSHPQV